MGSSSAIAVTKWVACCPLAIAAASGDARRRLHSRGLPNRRVVGYRRSARRHRCVLSTDAQEGFWREEREIERATSGSRALGLETTRPYSASLDRRRGLGARAESVASRDDGLPLSPHSLRDGGVFFVKRTSYRRGIPPRCTCPYAQTPGDLQGYGQAYVVSNDQKLDWANMFAIITQPPPARDMKHWPTQPLTFRYIKMWALLKKKI